MIRSIFIVIAVFAAHTIVAAEAEAAPSIQVDDPWVMEQLDTSLPSAVFMKIRNRGSKMDRLISVDSPIAGLTQIHRNMMSHEKMRMRRKTSLEIRPGNRLVLDHNGYHIMLMHLWAPLRRGTTFPLTLKFANSGPIEVEVEVRMKGHEKGHE